MCLAMTALRLRETCLSSGDTRASKRASGITGIVGAPIVLGPASFDLPSAPSNNPSRAKFIPFASCNAANSLCSAAAKTRESIRQSHERVARRANRANPRARRHAPDARAVCICCSRAPPPRSPRTTLATRAIGFCVWPLGPAPSAGSHDAPPVARSRMKRDMSSRCRSSESPRARRARWARRCVRFRFRVGLSRVESSFVQSERVVARCVKAR